MVQVIRRISWRHASAGVRQPGRLRAPGSCRTPAEIGPAAPEAVADAAGCAPRSVAERLAARAASGYVGHEEERFRPTSERRAVFADPDGSAQHLARDVARPLHADQRKPRAAFGRPGGVERGEVPRARRRLRGHGSRVHADGQPWSEGPALGDPPHGPCAAPAEPPPNPRPPRLPGRRCHGVVAARAMAGSLIQAPAGRGTPPRHDDLSVRWRRAPRPGRSVLRSQRPDPPP